MSYYFRAITTFQILETQSGQMFISCPTLKLKAHAETAQLSFQNFLCKIKNPSLSECMVHFLCSKQRAPHLDGGSASLKMDHLYHF